MKGVPPQLVGGERWQMQTCKRRDWTPFLSLRNRLWCSFTKRQSRKAYSDAPRLTLRGYRPMGPPGAENTKSKAPGTHLSCRAALPSPAALHMLRTSCHWHTAQQSHLSLSLLSNGVGRSCAVSDTAGRGQQHVSSSPGMSSAKSTPPLTIT